MSKNAKSQVRVQPYTPKDEAKAAQAAKEAAKTADAVAGANDALWTRTFHDALAQEKFKVGLYSYDPSRQAQLPMKQVAE